MCMRYMVTREDLGKRTTGFMFYDADSKGFVGMTERAIRDALSKGERLFGLDLNDGNIVMDTEGFKTKNYMVRSGINKLAPAVESDNMANIFYVVVGVRKEQGENVYEVVNSRYARLEMNESKIKMLIEFGALQGGVYVENGQVKVCDGVQTLDGANGGQNKAQRFSKGKEEAV